ncbi:ubiquinol-cytochrome C chaperone family protein [Sphingomonas sp. PAMC 26617]|uniref:ubiquinol-cytochrome C chaperone family protein n=1 Tax=Sphingomonas sp. PAMC 26617 TaxID=1112216 RepID=UPI000287E712|nr:ubiquinol-cytochrome C chaperone family protein [Sphingomonas sp. PAMC 26617]
MRLSWLSKVFGRRDDDVALSLYHAVVAQARLPHWYEAGGVPDTIDGRFDMIAAILSLVLLRLERDPSAAAGASARLTERFVSDMDGQLRESGVGDIGVGKHIGKMMGMLGGRLGAYRDGLAARDLRPALERNLYRSGAPAPSALAYAQDALFAFDARLAALPTPTILAGDIA